MTNNRLNEKMYESLYEYVRNNYKDKTHELPFSATTLYISSLSDNRTVKYDDIINLEIDEFVRALYLNLFLRFPEEGIIESLPRKFDSNDDELRFKNNYLEGVMLSCEAVSSGAKVIGYRIKQKKGYIVFLRKCKQHVFGFIYNKIWVKAPERLRKLVKRMVGR